jgi:hypothetical protein
MTSRFFAIGAMAVLAAVTASSADSGLQPNALRSRATPGSAHLYVVGIRSAQQRQSAADRKLDGALADLSRHATLVRPGYALADLRSLSPAARFVQASATATPLVSIDAVTRGDPQQLKSALVGLGLQHAAVYSNDVGGWLPVNQIEAAAARSEVVSMRAAMSRTRTTGPVATQGDYAQGSSIVRTNYPTLIGSGVTVGVLSDSFNCYAVYAAAGSGVPVSGNEGYAYNGFTADYATDVSTGALPSGVNVLAEPYTGTAGPSSAGDCLNYGAPTQTPFGDEGRAMLQIVHAIAPGAGLAFYTAENSEADFANGIGALATAGAKVIADDVGYFDEPFYQDGIVAQAIDAVEASGVAYFSAAGNDGLLTNGSTSTYQNTAPSFATLSTTAPNSGENLLNFDTSGATTTTSLPVAIPAIPPGDFVAVVVEWDQPYVTGCTATPSSLCTGATSSIDVCITGATGTETITNYDGTVGSCAGANATGTDPYQVMIISNPANAVGNTAAQNLNIAVGLVVPPGSTPATVQPGRVIVSVEDDGLGSSITSFATNSPTLQGHPGAAGAAAVGAAFYFDTPRCGTTPATLEYFSAQGGLPVLFSTAGVRLTTPVVRQKPDFVAPDGVNTTFLGYTLASAGITGSNGLLSTTIPECQNNPSYPNFFGTSAATPHAAAIAALMMQSNGAMTPTQIYTALRTTALPMGGTTPNYNSGYGFIQADAALASQAPGAPTLTLGATSIASTSTTTISWSSVNATSCTPSGNANTVALGSWIGPLATSGAYTLTPITVGTYTFSLTCSNATGTSAASTVTLTVTVAPTIGSGGGGLDGLTLLVLAGLGVARLLRDRRPARPIRSW